MKLLDKLLALPHGDKWAHFIGGVIIGVLAAAIIGPWAAIPAALTVGVVKEVYDAANKEKHTPDLLDAIATTLGGVLVYIIAV